MITSMNPENNREKQWIDFLLQEVKDPDMEARIQAELDEEGVRSSYEDLKEVIAQIRNLYNKEGRDDMFDLTLEQKKELYSEFMEVFPTPRSVKNDWLPSLRLALLSGGAALILIAAVPLVQWIAMPSNPAAVIMDGLEYDYEQPPLVIVPPMPKEKPKTDEPQVEIKLQRPSLDELTYPPMATETGNWSVGSITYDTWMNNIDDDIINLIDVDIVPRVISPIAPSYPVELKRAHVSGNVMVEFIVDEQGRVVRPLIVKSSHSGFNQSSLVAIRKWRFEPGRNGGKVVKVRMRMPFVFNIKN